MLIKHKQFNVSELVTTKYVDELSNIFTLSMLENVMNKMFVDQSIFNNLCSMVVEEINEEG